MVTDHPADHVIRQLHLAGQEWPPRLRVMEGEDRQSYRSRLSQQGYIAIDAAGLTTPKARYVEVINPLLSRRVVGVMRSLSPESRQYARAFAAIVHEQPTGIPYPRFPSTPPMSKLLHSPAMVDELVRELMSPEIERVLPADGAARVLATLALSASRPPTLKERTRNAIGQAADALPVAVYYRLKPPWRGPGALPPALLALRAALAAKTIRLLELDAGTLGGAR